MFHSVKAHVVFVSVIRMEISYSSCLICVSVFEACFLLCGLGEISGRGRAMEGERDRRRALESNCDHQTSRSLRNKKVSELQPSPPPSLPPGKSFPQFLSPSLNKRQEEQYTRRGRVSRQRASFLPSFLG